MYQKPLYVQPVAPEKCSMCCKSARAILCCNTNRPPHSSNLWQRFYFSLMWLQLLVSCGPATCFALFPQTSRRSGPNLGNVLLQEEVTNNGSICTWSETHALIMWCVHSAHIPLPNASHAANTDKFGWRRIFLPERRAPEQGPWNYLIFETNNAVFHTIDIL